MIAERLAAVLSYHKIGSPSPGGWETWYYVSEQTLGAHLEELRSGGWEFVDLDRFLAGLRAPTTLPPRSAVVTFDDAYQSLVSHALPVLCSFQCPAVVFVPTDYIGKTNGFDANTHEPSEPICDWDDLVQLQHSGVSIQSHGVSHTAFSELDASRIADQLTDSKAILEAGIGTSIDAFAFPYGDRGGDPNATSGLVRSCGYDAAFLYGGGVADIATVDALGIPRLAMGSDTVLTALTGRHSF